MFTVLECNVNVIYFAYTISGEKIISTKLAWILFNAFMNVPICLLIYLTFGDVIDLPVAVSRKKR